MGKGSLAGRSDANRSHFTRGEVEKKLNESKNIAVNSSLLAMCSGICAGMDNPEIAATRLFVRARRYIEYTEGRDCRGDGEVSPDELCHVYERQFGVQAREKLVRPKKIKPSERSQGASDAYYADEREKLSFYLMRLCRLTVLLALADEFGCSLEQATDMYDRCQDFIDNVEAHKDEIRRTYRCYLAMMASRE